MKLNTRLGNRLVLVIFQVFWHLKFDSLYLSLAIYHLSCSSFVFLGIVIVKVCFFPGADFLLNKALLKKKCQQLSSDERQKTWKTRHLWIESMSGAGPFLSLPAGYSILGRAIVAPPVVAAALHSCNCWHNELLGRGLPTCWRQPLCIS